MSHQKCNQGKASAVVRNWHRCPDCKLTWHNNWNTASEDACPRCKASVECTDTTVFEGACVDELRAYTVVLTMPDYIADPYGQDTEFAMVDATDPISALVAAQGTIAQMHRVDDPEDLAKIAMFAGHHVPIDAI